MYFFQIAVFVFWTYIFLRILFVKTGFVFRIMFVTKSFCSRSLMPDTALLTLGLWIIFWLTRNSGKSNVRWKLLDGVTRLWTRWIQIIQIEVEGCLNFNALRNSCFIFIIYIFLYIILKNNFMYNYILYVIYYILYSIKLYILYIIFIYIYNLYYISIKFMLYFVFKNLSTIKKLGKHLLLFFSDIKWVLFYKNHTCLL